MKKNKITESAISQVLSSLSSSFARQQHAMGNQLMETVGVDITTRLSEILEKTYSGDFSELPMLDVYFSIPKCHYEKNVPNIYPDLSAERHAQIVFFLTHYDDLERTAARWFSDIEGMGCSADRSRTLRRLLWRYLTTGAQPEPNYAQKYTYHLSKGSLVDPDEYLEWFESYKDLQQGNLTSYLLLFQRGKDRIRQRCLNPGIPLHRLPNEEMFFDFNEVKGRAYFVALACVSAYLPNIDHPDVRAHIIEYGADFSELENYLNESDYSELKDSLSSWVYKPGSMTLPVIFEKFGISPSELLTFIAYRLGAVHFGEKSAYADAKNALIAKLPKQEEGAGND